MNVNFTACAKTLIVSVGGELDQHGASPLREQIDLRIAHGSFKRLIFDFSELDFMDSSGIGVIIGRYKLMRTVNGTVMIVTDRSAVKKILELSGIGRIIKICDSLSDAMKIA